MAIIPWRPWLWEPWEDLDKWWGEKWPEIKTAEFVPPIDVYERGNNVVVETTIAGIDPEKVDVLVEDNTLILKGKSEKKSEVEEKNYYRKEVRYGSFYRAVSLPARVLGNKAEANYEDGVLRVTIPKVSEAKEKRVKIKVKSKK